MCRNIRTLFNFGPPATELEIRDASLQFVRKLSGFNAPSKMNEAAVDRAVEESAASARRLISSLVTAAEPRARGGSGQGAAMCRAALRCGAVTSVRFSFRCRHDPLDGFPRTLPVLPPHSR
jgi:hypothetical protein